MKDFTKNPVVTKNQTTIKDSTQQDKRHITIICLIIVIALCVFTPMIMVSTGTGLFFGVEPGRYAVMEKWGGEYKVYDKTGVYFRGIGKKFVYPKKENIVYKFSIYEDNEYVSTIFSNGEEAIIGMLVNVSLPQMTQKRIDLHRYLIANKMPLSEALLTEIDKAVDNTSQTFTAIEVATHQAYKFRTYCSEQIMNNLYKTISNRRRTKDGKEFIAIDFVENKYGSGFETMTTTKFSTSYNVRFDRVMITSITYTDKFNKRMDEEQKAIVMIKREEYELKVAELEKKKLKIEIDKEKLINTLKVKD